ncbi:MAG TPA: putative oxidoreductase C-terminal domain-containing protein [Bacteroidales bacterium]|nr:putative oxidoreductase C-terminal domain-containing protein [Bacteroidales bacterium]
MKHFILSSLLLALLATSCTNSKTGNNSVVRLITLDPGHFHAALVQKSMYEGVDSTVYVYAPAGEELNQHLKKIDAYNHDSLNPTQWNEEVYTGSDFLDKMLAEKKGNAVIISGNNRRKTEYIQKSVEAGFNVLADKPMAIDQKNFEILKKTFATAAEKKVLLYDIMTERSEITNTLQRELAALPEVFGQLQKGTPENPAVEMVSVHYFYKSVSGSTLIRPAWFMDVAQQGEGITDVATHLVDLVQWECFPDKTIDYQKDIQLVGANRWSTPMTLDQFSAITKLSAFPEYLKSALDKNQVLQLYVNGEIDYKLFGTYVKIKALWDYKATAGGDNHYSILKGSKSNLIIKQGAEQNYKPTLYIEPIAGGNTESYTQTLLETFKSLEAKYPGIELKKGSAIWEVVIPEKYKVGHEAHFAQVTNRFLDYLKNGNIPTWEVPNMIAKYFTTTQALEMAKNKK